MYHNLSLSLSLSLSLGDRVINKISVHQDFMLKVDRVSCTCMKLYFPKDGQAP